MPNPKIVSCPENTWTLVAENVTTGYVKTKIKHPNIYLETYRLTGGTPPTDQSEGIPFDKIAEISSSVAIDVYIMAVGSNGSVRVDA
jgi:hypothetical protein